MSASALTSPPSTRTARNSYLDVLRTAALARVVLLHSFFIGWTSFLIPSVGLMFALGGSMMAASLQRRSAGQVMFDRTKRVLVPLWALALFAVPFMVVVGHWLTQGDGPHPFSVTSLFYWVVPVMEPPGSNEFDLLWRTLWYLRTYLWLVVASVALFAAYKRWPKRSIVIAFAFPVLFVPDPSVVRTPDLASVVDFYSYVGFWMLGFAHQDGSLQRMPKAIHRLLVSVLGVAAVALLAYRWPTEHLQLTTWSDLNTLWSLPVLLVLLRWQPNMSWLSARARLSRFIRTVNSRAVTIYLWHPSAILGSYAASTWVVTHAPATLQTVTGLQVTLQLLMTAVLLATAVAVFGRVEELGKAKKKPPAAEQRRLQAV